MQELLGRSFYEKDHLPLLLILLGLMAWVFWQINQSEDEPSHYYDRESGKVKRR